MTLTTTGSRTKAPTRPPGILSRPHAETLEFDEARALWPALSASALSDNAFFDPSFLGPASDALGHEIEILGARDADGRLSGLMPLTPTRLGKIAPALSVLTHEYGPLGTPVVAHQAAIPPLVECALDRAGAGRALVFPTIAGNRMLAAIEETAATAGRIVTRFDSHQRAALDRATDSTDPSLDLPRRRRKEYARQMRRLGELGSVTVEHAIAPADIAKRFGDFLLLEASGWKGRRGTAMAKHPEIVSFVRQALADLAPRGAASIMTLSVADRPAAILICLHQGGTALTWKIAYNESLARFSPGALLMLEAPPRLFADKRIARIDSCATPNHPMVNHLWRGRLHLTSLIIGPHKRRWLAATGIVSHAIETRLGKSVGRLKRGRRNPPHGGN